MKTNKRVIISCEHFSARIPHRYRKQFDSPEAIKALKSHEGSDLGIERVYRYFNIRLSCWSQCGDISRLLIDLNRSPENPDRFSRFSRGFTGQQKQLLSEKYYHPYRTTVRKAVEKQLPDDLVLHLSLHSFTPVWKGVQRLFDIGILYDPSRPQETFAAAILTEALVKTNDIIVKHNQPYLGTDDGLCSWLRSLYPENYIGIELEFNQRILLHKPRKRMRILNCLRKAVENFQNSYLN